ncbi:MAG: hypothetical protein NVS4B6_06630 [Mycobacterium sp.]
MRDGVPERNVIMMRKLFAASGLVGVLIIGAAAPAYAGTGNPSGTGPPNRSCQGTANSSGQLATPGNSANSPGSPFDEPGFGPAPNGGTGGQHYSPKSQYDVACAKQAQHAATTTAPAMVASTTSAATGPDTPATALSPHGHHG